MTITAQTTTPPLQKILHDFKIRFLVTSIITIPLMILSLNIMPETALFLHALIPIPLVIASLTSIIFFYGGWPFFKGFLNETKQCHPGMMTLIFYAITITYGYSITTAFGVPGKPLFIELATLLDLLLFGQWVEMKAIKNASRSFTSLMEFMPKTAQLAAESESLDRAVIDVHIGDHVLVKAGEKIPLDGTIIEGLSSINQTLLTGESKAITKGIGEYVFGGSLNEDGTLIISVNKSSSQSYFEGVIKFVKQTLASSTHLENIVQRATQWLTLITMITGALTLYKWYAFPSNLDGALQHAVTVLISVSPHALCLAVPLVAALITTIAAHYGFLIKNRTRFEQCYKADMVLFDKTGTLTQGSLGVTDIITLNSWSKDELLANVAALEAQSGHPIAQNIVQLAHEKKLQLPEVSHFTSLAGRGIQGILNNRELIIGHKDILSLMSPNGKALHHHAIAETITRANKVEQEGKTVIVILYDDQIYGLIGLRDTIRKKSSGAIQSLNRMGIKTALITSDTISTAQKIAQQLGIQTVFANIMPDQKAAEIKKIQDQGLTVIMVGDEINDAAALIQADIGIALGTGTYSTLGSADITLVSNDPSSIVDIIKLSRISRRKMLQNLAWATSYNIIALPLAAGVLHPYGITISPLVGAIAMSLSTIIVAINSTRINFRKEQNL